MNPQRAHQGPLPAWSYEFFVDDYTLYDPEIRDGPFSDFFFNVNLRFPPRDLPTILEQ